MCILIVGTSISNFHSGKLSINVVVSGKHPFLEIDFQSGILSLLKQWYGEALFDIVLTFYAEVYNTVQMIFIGVVRLAE